ncbi:MAG: hypothetical protein E8D45_12075 [Nitrospira sp.]|nr:MAG: hypothetical protein E8D45_12075 [Nitrospira sp.]
MTPVSHSIEGQSGDSSPGTYSSLKGVVTKIDSGMIFVKPTEGVRSGLSSLSARNLLVPPSRAISSRKAERSGLRHTQVGDEVTLFIDEVNLVKDLYKTGRPAPARRMMTGTLGYANEAWEEIQLSSPAGPESFAVDPLAGTKLPALGDGAPVILELDDANTVIDIHRIR